MRWPATQNIEHRVLEGCVVCTPSTLLPSYPRDVVRTSPLQYQVDGPWHLSGHEETRSFARARKVSQVSARRVLESTTRLDAISTAEENFCNASSCVPSHISLRDFCTSTQSHGTRRITPAWVVYSRPSSVPCVHNNAYLVVFFQFYHVAPNFCFLSCVLLPALYPSDPEPTLGPHFATCDIATPSASQISG